MDQIVKTSPSPRAPYPSVPVRQFSFTDWSVNNPTTPQPGDRLDSEYDRSNASTAQIVTWASVSLNTDGTIRAGVVGSDQLVAGLFDDISQGIIDDVQPLVDEATGAANSALASSAVASTAATNASAQANAAGGAASDAWASANIATTASEDAVAYAETAQAAANAASDDANHAQGDAAKGQDYAVLAQAWAEYMPDTIPPNILASNDVTGEHWSSRWWAHKAAAAFGQLSELYLGALPAPPTTTSTGDPIPTGGIYYNTTTGQPYIWNGTEWVQFYAPTKAVTLSLIYQAAAGQTQFITTVPDLAGNVWTFDVNDPEPVELHVNGVRLPQTLPAYTGDWSLDVPSNTVTFVQPLLAGTLVIIDVLAPASKLAPRSVTTQQLLDFDIDPVTGNPGQIDGVRTSFPLALANDRSTVIVANALEIQVFIDGITQKPGNDYNVSASTITFGEAPTPGGTAWGLWFGPVSGTTRAETVPVPVPAPAPALHPDVCVCPVGTLLTSVLNPDTFAAELGERAADWVLTDGRTIAGTRLAQLTGDLTAPVFVGSLYHYVRVN